MRDENKTKEQLTTELMELRQRIAELGKLETDRRQAEEKIEHLNLVLRAIRGVNQLIVKEKDRDTLLQGTCENLIKTRGYYNAWIALLDESGDLVTTAEAGLGKGFLPMVKRLKRGELTDCAQKALKQSDVVVTEDPLSTCADCPLSTMYSGRGATTVRLEHGGRIHGLLAVSIPRDFLSDEEERGLFKEVADDIAFALHGLELEEEQKRAEETLLESEKRFRDLVENSLTGISIIQDNRIAYQNPEQQRLFGPLSEVFKLTSFEGIHPDDVENVKQFFQGIALGRVQNVDTDFRFYPKGKTESGLDMKWVYCRVSLIEYQGKQALLVNMMDVTRAKELEHLVRIQDKMTSLGRVATGIAHEIRNPLSGINIYLNTLEKIYDKGESLEKVKGILAQLQSASNKIESVIRRVMDFSKPTEPKYAMIDINKPIEEAISLSSVMLRKGGVKLEKTLAEDLPPCRADPQLIEEVILNLITNAAEATRNVDGARKIGVTSSMENNRISVRVFDSGPGIPSNIGDKVFDPFYSTKNGGTGIGLSLSHRIITDHGGSLRVGTSRWGGAEFVIEIPIEKPHT